MEKKLEELKNLLDSGAITESEHQELKQKLLDKNTEVNKQNESNVAAGGDSDIFEDLIPKYNPNEKDLFLISCIQDKIKTSSSYFEKQKLKAKALKLLKPYKVKFMDLGILIDQIAEKEYHLKKELQDKYDTKEIESIKQSFGLKYTLPIILFIIAIFLILFLVGDGGDKDKKIACGCLKEFNTLRTNSKLYQDCLVLAIAEGARNDPYGYFKRRCEAKAIKTTKTETTPVISNEMINTPEEEDYDYEEDMGYGELGKYEEEPAEENSDNYYNDSESNGYVNVENLNFRSTPNIQENNIIGKLFNGQQVVIVNTIQSNTDSPKGLLKKETILEYKGNELKLQPGKAVDIIEPLEELDSNGRIIRMLYKCKAILNSNESITFNIDADFLEVISTEDWSQIEIEDGTIGYVYSRFITEM